MATWSQLLSLSCKQAGLLPTWYLLIANIEEHFCSASAKGRPCIIPFTLHKNHLRFHGFTEKAEAESVKITWLVNGAASVLTQDWLLNGYVHNPSVQQPLSSCVLFLVTFPLSPCVQDLCLSSMQLPLLVKFPSMSSGYFRNSSIVYTLPPKCIFSNKKYELFRERNHVFYLVFISHRDLFSCGLKTDTQQILIDRSSQVYIQHRVPRVSELWIERLKTLPSFTEFQIPGKQADWLSYSGMWSVL